MSAIDDIPRRLTYTELCGWVDAGHAGYKFSHIGCSGRPYYQFDDSCGAARLWRSVNAGTSSRSAMSNGYLVKYEQLSGSRLIERVLSHTEVKAFVADGLSLPKKIAVARSMMMSVSKGHEWKQRLGFVFTDSGFSVEDLVSNMIGLYSAVHGDVELLNKLIPYSEERSKQIFREIGNVGKWKNTGTTPYLYDPATKSMKISPIGLNEILSIIMKKNPGPNVGLSREEFRPWGDSDTGEDVHAIVNKKLYKRHL